MKKTELIQRVMEMHRESNNLLQGFPSDQWIDLNLTIAQLKSLFFIAEKGTTNFKKLADALNVTPPNITGIIDRLVEQNLVSRKENPEDRRIMLLQMTQKGQELMNTLHEYKTAQITQILDSLSQEELNDLFTGLTALVRATQEWNQKNVNEPPKATKL